MVLVGVALIFSGDAPVTPTTDAFAEARALAHAGFDDAARAELREVIGAEPHPTAPPDLRYLTQDWFPPMPGGAPARTDLWIVWRLLISFGALAVVWVALALAIRRLATERLAIDDFDDGAAETKLGKTIAALISQELDDVRHEARGANPQIVSGPEPAIGLPAATQELSPHLKLLSSILELVPSRTCRIKGILHPPGQSGVGLTVSVVDHRGRTLDSTTIWESSTDALFEPRKGDKAADTKAYHRLAIAAAAWAIYVLPLDADDKQKIRILTADGMSHMHFRMGVTWQRSKDLVRSRRSYLDAIAADRANIGALLNVGVVDLTDSPERPATAEARFARALALLEERQVDQRDRLWYRARYNLAVAQEDQGVLVRQGDLKQQDSFKERAGDGHLAAADETATTLITAADMALGELTKEVVSSDPADDKVALARFIETIRAMAVVLRANVRVRLGRPEGPEIDEILNERDAESYRVRYNLACYFASERKAKQDEALKELRHGLERGNLNARALVDPTLEHLRTTKLDDFNEVLSSFSSKAAKPVLARFTVIGTYLAARLKDRDVTSLVAVKDALALGHVRQRLATDWLVSRTRLDEVWELARLSSIRGIGEQYAELLYQAGIGSVDTLVPWTAPDLASRLAGVVEASKLEVVPPTKDETLEWIKEARGVPPEVVAERPAPKV